MKYRPRRRDTSRRDLILTVVNIMLTVTAAVQIVALIAMRI